MFGRFVPNSIGRFQLSNLISQQLSFVFFDFRKKVEKVESLQGLISRAECVSDHQVAAILESRSIDKSMPIVLLCENGRRSSKLAKQLEKQQYQNVYVIARGFKGLFSNDG